MSLHSRSHTSDLLEKFALSRAGYIPFQQSLKEA